MMKYIKNCILVSGLSFFVFSFYGIEQLKPADDNSNTIELASFSAPKSLAIDAHVMTTEEIRQNISSSLDDYRVVALAIDNPGPHHYELKKEFVDLDLLGRKELMKDVRLSALPRSIFFRIAGFFFWPAMIPGTLDTFFTLQSQRSIGEKLHASTIKKEGEILLPYSKIYRYLYIPTTESKNSFEMKFLNSRTLKYETYNVDIG